MEFTRNRKLPFAISNLTRLEFNSAIAKEARTGRIDKNLARKIINNFTAMCQNNIANVPIVTGDFQKAEEMIAEQTTSLKALDSLHLAIAYHNDCTLVTADKQLATAAMLFGIDHFFVSYETKESS